MADRPLDGVESLSRRGLAALLVGLSGPAAGLVVFYLLADRVLFGAVDDSADLGTALAEGLVDLVRLLVVAFAVGALVTLVGFVVTRARWAVFGWLGSVVLFPFWNQVVMLLPDLGPVGYAFTLGVAPGVVRFCLPTHHRVPAEVRPATIDR